MWAAEGEHPAPTECCHPPVTATAIAARRAANTQRAASRGEAEPRFTEFDLWPLVVRAGIRNTADARTAHLQLQEYAKKHCSVAMCAFLFKHRAKLPNLVDDIWAWECAEEVLEVARRSRLGALTAARCGPCVCGGEWLSFVVGACIRNAIPMQALCVDIYNAMARGRSETTPVVVLAGGAGGEGKSVCLKPLTALFAPDEVFNIPKGTNFPMLGVERAKVVVLDDWRFDTTVLSFATQCLWFDGSGVPVSRPQNLPSMTGHFLYQGTAPIFVTTKAQDIEELRAHASLDGRTRQPKDGDASMLCRRPKVYHFSCRAAKPDRHLPYCARCFSQFVCSQAACAAA